jgi:hypothetical protein
MLNIASLFSPSVRKCSYISLVRLTRSFSVCSLCEAIPRARELFGVMRESGCSCNRATAPSRSSLPCEMFCPTQFHEFFDIAQTQASASPLAFTAAILHGRCVYRRGMKMLTKVRTRYQPANGQGNRGNRSTESDRAGRRSDRINNVRYWPKADMSYCTANVRFWGVKQT